MKYFVVFCGKTQSHHVPVENVWLRGEAESSTLEESNFILAFCPLVSRIGTDIDAALGKIPESKPVILVLMHHTFDPDYVVPDSRRFVEGRDIFLVDCLFYEDQGLLECSRNHVAHQNILQKIQSMKAAGESNDNVPAKEQEATGLVQRLFRTLVAQIRSLQRFNQVLRPYKCKVCLVFSCLCVVYILRRSLRRSLQPLCFSYYYAYQMCSVNWYRFG